MDGQPAQAEGQATLAPETGEAAEQVQNGEPQELAVQLATIQERYKHSSTEGQRLHAENKRLQQELESTKQRSLTPAAPVQNQPQFPTRENYIKWVTDTAEKTEKEAAFEYDRELHAFQKTQFLETQIKALTNLVRFKEQSDEQSLTALNPLAKEAQEFCKQIPELNALPISEKIARYEQLKPMLTPKASGKDLTAAKMAASGAQGGAARALPEVNASEMDSMAKEAGFPSYKAMQEFSNVNSVVEREAFAKKWKMKV